MSGDEISLVLLVTHPKIDPDEISKNILLKPLMMQKVGDQITTPKGVVVENSFYKFSKWQHIVEIHSQSKLEEELSLIIEHLSKFEGFIRQIVDSGGKIQLFFTFNETEHIGFEVNNILMQKMATLKITFGFEFFN